ncbi:gene transfer agent family protein [Sphingomonas sp. ABOLF]|uniref:gene transfer agent family protein n=1 Tax=Sphingomonas sp. ABOLF TaxID=1985879 RepID=UPI0013E0BF62|nr:gene transfer agent family protein [Sphingomonas sp. ABOLF]
MTPTTALTLHFADGEYLFDLKLPQLAELQEKRGAGVFKIYSRVMQGRFLMDGQPIALAAEGEAFAEDLFETIRLGLIGGAKGIVNGQPVAVNALTAKLLVERYSHPAPLRESWATAAAILGARIEGYDPPKKKAPAAKPATKPRKSTSAKSSRTAGSSEPTGGN